MSDKDRTHFGYKEVDTDAKAGMVADVFHSVASRYDLMNDLMSGGIHRVWKRFTIELSGVRAGDAVLDIAGGTGDLAARFSDIVGANDTELSRNTRRHTHRGSGSAGTSPGTPAPCRQASSPAPVLS